MRIKPIRTEADYEACLARVEELMNAEPDTPEGDELEVLSALVEQYEDAKYPVEAPTPVAAIRFRMEQQGLTPRDLEPFIGSRGRVSEVLSGVRSLSIDMIRALNLHLGIPAEVLIQADPVTEAKAGPALSVPASRQLEACGLMRRGEELDSFLVRAVGGAPAMAMLRKTRTERTNAKTDPAALQAWCAAAILRSRSALVTGRFQARRINSSFVRKLARLSTEHNGPKLAVEALASEGIAFVFLPHLPGTYLDGAAMYRSDGVPLIALTLRRDRIDNFWFTLLHELAHVKFHLKHDTPYFVDDLEVGSTLDLEQEADDMAGKALIPDDLWATFESGAYASYQQLYDFAERAEVHPAIVAGRWQRENHDFRKFSKILGHGSVEPLFASAG